MARARRREHDAGLARIGNAVMNDVAQKLRAGNPPTPARRIAVQLPQSLAGGNQQRHATFAGAPRLLHFRSPDFPAPGGGLQKLRLSVGADKTGARLQASSASSVLRQISFTIICSAGQCASQVRDEENP
jgi:hypothetical protein